MQKRFPNGTFAPVDPAACSANDPINTRACSLQSDNTVGFFESSSWEYSWFVPHDTAHLISLMGGDVSDYLAPVPLSLTQTIRDFRFLQNTFVKRLNHFFDAGYFGPGNEPSFQVRSLSSTHTDTDSTPKYRMII
jgi:putative alpha-1,2-mannosidase